MTDTASGPLPPPLNTPYIGRFAPSPTGPLHMGSLVAALASFLDARHHKGAWLLRMEDLDPPRETQEAADQILSALNDLGLHWDGPVLYQSQRTSAYNDAINRLQTLERIFACDCSRQQIQDAGGVYTGTCRNRGLADGAGLALRCRTDNSAIVFCDSLQGEVRQKLEREVGDFVIRRKDGLFAYQLAVVVDDAFQNITHVVRGIDLLDSTARQIHLQHLLGCSQPEYTHIPVIVNDQGQKLSKQHFAKAVDPNAGAALLVEALKYLKQSPDSALESASVEEVLAWGIQHWQPQLLVNLSQLEEFVPPLSPGV